MKLLSILSLSALVALTPAQKASDWRKSTFSPIAFGKKMDDALLNLKNAIGEAAYQCQYFDGGFGHAKLVNRVRDRKTFRVEFVKVSEGSKDPLSFQTLSSNNGKIHLISSATGIKPLPAGKNPGLVPTNMSLVSSWPKHFQQSMFQSYVTGSGSFAQFMKDLTSPNSGYQVRIDTRTMQGSGRSVPQMRIFATRTPAAEKKLGKGTIEIVAATAMWLPLQIRVNQTNLKGKTAFYDWECRWRGPLRFDNKWFSPKA